MTQEEKAKAYDEAIKKIQEIIIMDDVPVTPKEIGEYLFPELKESEDERVKKAIYNALKYLETELSWDTLYYGVDILDVYAWLEKQGEQKPADNVETKSDIEKGKWYVCDTPRYKDFVVGKAYYCPKNGMLKPNENEMARYVASHCFHLWTIQDAKDGDVLVASDGSILLFKCVVDAACKHYIALTTDNVVNINEGLEHYWETSRAVHPATKEQRDLLFQKIKEAGYEWDAEKKELRKIEQNPANVFNIYEKPLLEKFKQAVYDCAWGKATCKTEGETQEEYAERWAEQFLLIVRDWADDYIDFTIQQKLRKSYDKRKENAIKENSSSWSEEDEDKISEIKSALYDYYTEGNADELFYWLNSLKERVL